LLKLEAALYGSGGSYKNDGKSQGSGGEAPGRVHDLTTDEGRAKLKALGF
jgi:hypothetical protein